MKLAFGRANLNLTGDGPAQRVRGLRVTRNLFDLLGVRARRAVRRRNHAARSARRNICGENLDRRIAVRE